MKKLIILATFLVATLNAESANVCLGIKANGQHCKSTIVGKNGYCNAHNPEATKCTFVKKNGQRCKMNVKAGQPLCRFHNK
jgi:hypothetical protein